MRLILFLLLQWWKLRHRESKLLILYEVEPEFETCHLKLKSPCLKPLQSSEDAEVAYQEHVWD